MLIIDIKGTELFDEETQEFINVKPQKIQLEHSLVSLSKWESKWNKPFLSRDDKTIAETLDYIKCMTITQNVNPHVYNCFDDNTLIKIQNYIQAPMTATTFSKQSEKAGNREVITSEIIYYWMISCNIPMECQKWHLNRLLTLIKVCSIKNAPPKKMSSRDLTSRNAALNAARRRRMGTKG